MTKLGHNSGFAKQELYSFVQRLERLNEEKDGLIADIKEVYGEAKANGFDVAIMRKVMQRRKQDSASLNERDELINLYETALREAESEEREQSARDGA